ncbi:glycosyltransferase [Schaalia sp. 19OD2882]|uniref:glycosyltransferase n=1 Tax=Schaalia sp. 19OD2882 TaxID=2794089 RepID=UPI001C1F1743|nr:glycosyltransferase [Schaalia sp. 19OD2882]QWW20283.1 glycosyltransferase [Schaalia sp. 19OD2882]
MSASRIAAVVVAWNRADMLVDTLDALAGQTRPLDDLVVVDNASTDTTPQVLAAHPGVTDIVTMTRNLGGAGGFAAGIARAIARGADLVWIMDDDTVPHPDALEALLRVREDYEGTPAVLACRADWTDGREHPMNRPRTRVGLAPRLHRKAEAVGARQIRTASFVAILIDARAVREEGLPQADYFLWNDDFEYTSRLLRTRIGLYVDGARVEHRTKVFGNSTADPGPRMVNEVRNKVWAFTRSPGLSPADKILFGGMTALRWARLLATTSERGAMAERIVDGVRQGLHAPRATSEVLAGTPVAAEVAALDVGGTGD